MRFYKQQHQFYCGIDLHARKMYVCILDQKGKTRLHKNIPTEAVAASLRAAFQQSGRYGAFCTLIHSAGLLRALSTNFTSIESPTLQSASAPWELGKPALLLSR